MRRTVDPARLRRSVRRSMALLAVWTMAVAPGGCASDAEPGGPLLGLGSWSKRSSLVHEDVAAILEGMATARGTKTVVLRAPEYRSSRPSD